VKTRFHTLSLASTALVAVGAWVWLSLALRDRGGLDMTPNIASIGMSPYGKTLALVVQGPIDAYWHVGEDDHDHEHEAGEADCPECAEKKQAEHQAQASEGPVLVRAKAFVEELTHCAQARNNPHGQTEAHKRYLRRQIENKLSSAYWLDPSNYANYNAYHLFLTESALGTREHSLADVLALCDQTRAYVEREKINPEPWLTAASALLAKMELVFLHRNTMPEARETMARSIDDMGFCLNRYVFLRDCQVAAQRWTEVSEPRREVMEQRHQMLDRLLEAQKTILKERFPQGSKGGQPG